MPWDYEFTGGDPFDVVVRLSGEPSYEELREGRRLMLADPGFRAGLNVLVDASAADFSGASAESLRRIASDAGREYGAADVAALVLLAPQAVTFGLLRMFHTFLPDALARRSAVVGTLEEGCAWLAARRP